MSGLAQIATIRGGYTMADLARLAAVAARRHGGGGYDDRYEAAWFGIAEALYSGEAEAERDLLWAGIRSIQREADQHNQAQGRSRRHGYEFGSAPSFAVFWNQALTTHSPEQPVVERVALHQALATLTAEQYEALAAVAVCATLHDAADALGVGYAALLGRYYAAREQVRRLWHQHETPRTERATEEECGSGHRRVEHWHTGPSGHGYCRECQRLAKARRRARGAAA